MKSAIAQKRVGSLIVNGVLAVIVILWIIPVVGVLVSSFRQRFDIQTTPWWGVFPHRDWVATKTLDPRQLGLNPDAPMTVEGVTATFSQLQAGIEQGGVRLKWLGTKRIGKIEVQERQWITGANLSWDNYRQVMGGQPLQIKSATGEVSTVRGDDFSSALLNSLIVAIPSTVIPILIAAFAAYGLAWMRFAGRRLAFTLVVVLLVVPLQIALVPVLRDFAALHLNGTFLGIWLAHTGFGLPLAIFLLYGYIRALPREILESAFIDGASHFTVFIRLVLPLSIPALAAFAIFQFLWVWNDYLVALIILGPAPSTRVVTMNLANIVGDRGQDWYLLTAGAFMSMIIPLLVFFSLQRYFVRGLLAGSVKG
jgi:alpha-glucoside transport system permease protein